MWNISLKEFTEKIILNLTAYRITTKKIGVTAVKRADRIRLEKQLIGLFINFPFVSSLLLEMISHH